MRHNLKNAETGIRFQFGENWRRFIEQLDDKKILAAENSIKEFMKVETLAGVDMVDVGSGSGLFSLAARRLGAKVHSFDFDSDSVECTRILKNKYFPNDVHWTVDEGSILNSDYLKTIGTFDLVYSWGVLHHTGDMWRSIRNTASLVRDDGLLLISIYNDQGFKSKLWLLIKLFYNWLSKLFKKFFSRMIY